jgi:hypothetical protein
VIHLPKTISNSYIAATRFFVKKNIRVITFSPERNALLTIISTAADQVQKAVN